LVTEGYAVYAPDHHGHGRSDGARARVSVPAAVADLDQLILTAKREQPGLDVFLLGHSMGGAIALRYAIAHQDRLTGLVLSGPLAQIDGPSVQRIVINLIARVAPGLGVIKLDANLVSRDPAVVKAYSDDPLVHHRAVPATTLAAFLDHVATLPEDVARITLPTLLMYGTADGLCPPAGAVMVSRRIGARDMTTTPYAGLYHEILNEPEQNQVLDELCAWLAARVPAASAAQ
jgi:lysophospholipase